MLQMNEKRERKKDAQKDFSISRTQWKNSVFFIFEGGRLNIWQTLTDMLYIHKDSFKAAALRTS
jgi:hypothetical protein